VQTFLPYEAGRLRRLGGEGRADATRAALLGFTAGRVPDTGQLRRTGQLPPWLGEEAVHVSHRSSLLRKDPAHYRRFFPTEPDDLPYVWPPAAFPRRPVRRARPKAVTAEAAAGCGLVVLDRVSGIADLGLPVLALG